MPLDRPMILRSAFAILNESGPETLTLRRLAKELGVQAPAMYWHFKNKQELLDEMGTFVMREAAAEAPEAGDGLNWEEWAIEYGLGLRRTLLRYREGARMFSGTRLTDPGMYSNQDKSLRKLTEAGFTVRAAVYGMGVVYSYTIGFVIEEQAAQPMPDEANPNYDLEKRNERINRNLYPLAYAAGEVIFTDYTTRFRAGLEIIVRGMAGSLRDAAATAAAAV